MLAAAADGGSSIVTGVICSVAACETAAAHPTHSAAKARGNNRTARQK
ncbi:uncharacterized protein BCN122_I2314 [Burkholderia cenocepacia]|nr:uncharacterized protein BCN122_I2314 [Burkholderia cenocepacia]